MKASGLTKYKMGKSKELFNQIREREAQGVDYTRELQQFNELAPKNLTSEEKAKQFINTLQKQGKITWKK